MLEYDNKANANIEGLSFSPMNTTRAIGTFGSAGI
jgi:hypothetical protein